MPTKKTLICIPAVLVTIILLLLLIPALVGQFLKYDLKPRLERAELPKNYQLKVINYRTGWFNTEADLQLVSPELTLPLAQKIGLNKNIDFHVVIYHGPIIFFHNLANEPVLFFGRGVMKGQAEVMGYPVNLYAKNYLNGAFKVYLVGPGFAYQDPQTKLKVALKEFIVELKLNSQLRIIRGSTGLSDLSISKDNNYFSLSKILTNYNRHYEDNLTTSSDDSIKQDAGQIWNGKSTTFISTIALVQNDIVVLKINNFSLINKTDISKDPITGNASITAEINAAYGKLILNSHDILGHGYLHYRLSGMSLQNFLNYRAFLRDYALNSRNQKAELKDQLPILIGLADVLQGTTQEINNTRLITPTGTVEISGILQLPRQESAFNLSQQPTFVAEAMLPFMFAKANGQLSLTMPTPFVEKIMQKVLGEQTDVQQRLQQYQQIGFIQINNDTVTANFSYQWGKININGAPLSEIISRYQAQKASQETPAQPVSQTGAVQPNNQQASPATTPAPSPAQQPNVTPPTPSSAGPVTQNLSQAVNPRDIQRED